MSGRPNYWLTEGLNATNKVYLLFRLHLMRSDHYGRDDISEGHPWSCQGRRDSRLDTQIL